MSRPLRTLIVAAALLAALAPPTRADDTPTPSATYRLRFQSAWNSTNHPDDFPLGAHFSALIGATHDGGFSLWAPGGSATDGIEFMAEAGTTPTLAAEIDAQLGAGGVGARLNGPALFGINGAVNMTFDIDQAHPLVSVVTMIAPSPDWFVGVRDLPLFENGNWVAETSVELLAWDAGTDSGTTFTSPNADVTPHLPIALQSGEYPLEGFVPLGTFTFTRQDLPEAWTDLGQGLAGASGVPLMQVTGALLAGETVTLELSGAAPSAAAPVVLGTSLLQAPFKQGVLVPAPDQIFQQFSTNASGGRTLVTSWPAGVPAGVLLAMQWWVQDAGAPAGWAASNGVCSVTL